MSIFIIFINRSWLLDKSWSIEYKWMSESWFCFFELGKSTQLYHDLTSLLVRSLPLATPPVSFSALLTPSDRFASLISLSVLSISSYNSAICCTLINFVSLDWAVIQLEQPHIIAIIVWNAFALHLHLVVCVYILEFLANYCIEGF